MNCLFSLRVVYTKQPKLVWFLLSDCFCQAVRLIFVSIWLTDITLHKIGQRDWKISVSKLVREPGKIGRTAWQNWSDMTKIGSTTVHVNGALPINWQFVMSWRTENCRAFWFVNQLNNPLSESHCKKWRPPNICTRVFLHLIAYREGVRVYTVVPNGLYSCFRFHTHKDLPILAG